MFVQLCLLNALATGALAGTGRQRRRCLRDGERAQRRPADRGGAAPALHHAPQDPHAAPGGALSQLLRAMLRGATGRRAAPFPEEGMTCALWLWSSWEQALAAASCSPIEQQATVARPAVVGRPYIAGVGDTVLDLKQTQSLPNIMGKADIFGRTRDAGRVIVRFVGVEGNQAVFVRQDVVIQSNETTMSRDPTLLPNYQISTVSGTVGTVPVSAARPPWARPIFRPRHHPPIRCRPARFSSPRRSAVRS